MKSVEELEKQLAAAKAMKTTNDAKKKAVQAQAAIQAQMDKAQADMK
jgi:hypothetical protein